MGGEKANFHFNDSGTKCGVMVRRNNNMVDGSDAGSRSSKVHEKKASNTFMFTRKKVGKMNDEGLKRCFFFRFFPSDEGGI